MSAQRREIAQQEQPSSVGLGATAADAVFAYGDPGGTVLVGDCDGNGTDTLAVRHGITFYVKNSVSTGTADSTFSYGDAGDVVLVGDWDGDGADTLVVRRGGGYFGLWYLEPLVRQLRRRRSGTAPSRSGATSRPGPTGPAVSPAGRAAGRGSPTSRAADANRQRRRLHGGHDRSVGRRVHELRVWHLDQVVLDGNGASRQPRRSVAVRISARRIGTDSDLGHATCRLIG
jgi:hypothetical protein